MLESTQRKCSNCGEQKPLDELHYQRVKCFKEGSPFIVTLVMLPNPEKIDYELQKVFA